MASVIEYMCGKISRGGLWIKAGVTRNVLNIYKSLAHIKQFPFNLLISKLLSRAHHGTLVSWQLLFMGSN